jgi:hypothetical protein
VLAVVFVVYPLAAKWAVSAITVNRPFMAGAGGLGPPRKATIYGGWRGERPTIGSPHKKFGFFSCFSKKAFDRAGMPPYTRLSFNEGLSVTPLDIRVSLV